MKKLLFCLALLGLVACNENKPAANEQQQQQEEQFVDANLPSGSQWAAAVEKTTEKPDGLFTAEEAQALFSGRIPTKDQWAELLMNSTITKKGKFLEIKVKASQENKAPARRGIADLPEDLLEILVPLAGKLDCEAEDLEDQLMAYLWAATPDDPMKKLEWYVAIQESGFSFANAAEACAELSVLLVKDNTVEVPALPIPTAEELIGTWECKQFSLDGPNEWENHYLVFYNDGYVQFVYAFEEVLAAGEYSYIEKEGKITMRFDKPIYEDIQNVTAYLTTDGSGMRIGVTYYKGEEPIYQLWERTEAPEPEPEPESEFTYLTAEELYGTWKFLDLPESMQHLASKMIYFGSDEYFSFGTTEEVEKNARYTYTPEDGRIYLTHAMEEEYWLNDGKIRKYADRVVYLTWDPNNSYGPFTIEKVSDENLIGSEAGDPENHPTAANLVGTWKFTLVPSGLEDYNGTFYYFGSDGVIQHGTREELINDGSYTYNERTGECPNTWPNGLTISVPSILTKKDGAENKIVMTFFSDEQIGYLEKVSDENLIGMFPPMEGYEHPAGREVYFTWVFYEGDFPAEAFANMYLNLHWTGYEAKTKIKEGSWGDEYGSYHYDGTSGVLTVDVEKEYPLHIDYMVLYWEDPEENTIICQYVENGILKTCKLIRFNLIQ